MHFFLIFLLLHTNQVVADITNTDLTELSVELDSIEDESFKACGYDEKGRKWCSIFNGILVGNTSVVGTLVYESISFDNDGAYTKSIDFAEFGEDDKLQLNSELDCMLVKKSYRYTLEERAVALMMGILVKNRDDLLFQCFKKNI